MEIGDWNTSELRKFFFRFSSASLNGDMSKGSNEIYEFGAFRLNVGEHVFERTDGKKNGSLPEKAFQTLAVLVRNHGNLVTKDELLEAVWPDTIVEENNLDKAIHAIRAALGEKRGEQDYIETVRKHGYRFVADVREIAPDVVDSNEDASSVRPFNAVFTTSWRRWMAVGSLAIVAVGLSTYLVVSRAVTTSSRKPSVAVLPLKPLNPAARDELIEFGIPDSLIHQLSSTRSLTVRPLDATRRYADSSLDAIAAGKEQNTDFVLASNYQLVEDRVRITSQLINVATGEIEETYRTEKNRSGIFAVQDGVAMEMGARILARFAPGQTSTASIGRGTDNEEAYRLYIAGKNRLSRRGGDAIAQARELFQAALNIDPNYAKAWAGLAQTYLSFSTERQKDAEVAGKAIDRALEIDPNLAEAFDARMRRKLYYDRDFKGAEQDALKAKSLAPDTGEFCSNYALLLVFTGRLDEAVEESNRAIELDPSSVMLHRNLGIVLFNARRFDETIDQLERTIKMDPDFGTTYFWLMQPYQFKGDYQKAYEIYINHIAEPQMRTPERIERFKSAFASGGWRALSEARLRAWKESHQKGEGNLYHMAFLSAELGFTDDAFKYLNELADNRAQQIVRIKVDPQMDPLRSDPRFDELLNRVGF